MNGPFIPPVLSPVGTLEEPCLGIFNGSYRIIKLIGEGHTSKVYKGEITRSTGIPLQSTYVAIKIIKEDYLDKDPTAKKALAQEILAL
jgi:serine/threonine protein kinase